MSKLRQKNPGTIRVPEEDKGRANYTMDLFLDIPQSGIVSKHISDLCSDALETTYTRYEDLKQWAQRPGKFELKNIIILRTVNHFSCKCQLLDSNIDFSFEKFLFF